MGLQVIEAGLACYAVPVNGFEHNWGVSNMNKEKSINYFGKELKLNEIHSQNRKKFIEKWKHIIINMSSS
jgi:hypothetical protein